MNHQDSLLTDDWELSRLYVWNDPILDRAAFEERLREEPHLAELVAEAVGEYLDVRAACAQPQVKNTVLVAHVSEPNPTSRYLVNAAWALSIAVAVAFLVIPSQWNSENEANMSLSSLAQTWSELYQQQSLQNSSEPMDSPIDPTELYDDLAVLTFDDLDGDLPDWLLAAIEVESTNAGVTP